MVKKLITDRQCPFGNVHSEKHRRRRLATILLSNQGPGCAHARILCRITDCSFQWVPRQWWPV